MTTHAQELERYRSQNKKSREFYERAERILPLGVSSNFRTYEPYPIYIERAQGSKMWDVDGREYTDFSMTFGALMVGHAHPLMVEALGKAAGEGTLYGMPHDREIRAAELIGSASASSRSASRTRGPSPPCTPCARPAPSPAATRS